MTLRQRIHKFMGTLLEKGEWDQVEAEELFHLADSPPGSPSGKKFECVLCHESMTKGVVNYSYMLTNEVWRTAGMKTYEMAHLPCVEKKVGREFTKEDFSSAPINSYIHWMLDNGIPIPKG